MFWIIRYSFKTPNHFLSLKGRKLQLFVCPKEIILNANQIYQLPNNRLFFLSKQFLFKLSKGCRHKSFTF